MNTLYNVKNENEKIKKVLDKYIELIKLNNNKSRKILLLVPNNIIKLSYEKKINLNYSEELNITTYLNFVKKELIKFWQSIKSKFEDIKSNLISPIFISNDLSNYIITNETRKRRNSEGYFEDITSTNRGIANNININISKALQNLIDFKTIGDRLYLSKKNKENILRFSYTQMNDIVNYYIENLLEKGMLDNSLSIYLYNKYLLSDKEYIKDLQKNIEYIIVDSLENCSNAEVDFIEKASFITKDSYVYFNKSRDYSSFNNIDMKYINEKIVKSFTDSQNKTSNEKINVQ